MNLALIPAAALIFLLLVTPSNKGDAPSLPKTKTLKEKPQKIISVEKKSEPQDDYKTILSYIINKYTQIKEEDAKTITKHLVDYGEKNNVDPKFAAAVIARESAFNTNAVSSTGAKGLGQIKDFNFSSLNIINPHDIEQNVSGTTQYLKEMLLNWQKRMNQAPEYRQEGKRVPINETEKVQLALASYYKGFTAVNREGFDTKTKGYVDDILKYYEEITRSKK
jgi:membrane-bound lytic murein transglycosylase MltF